MRLTRKKAIELCIELWTWLAKTGKLKEDWPKWEEYSKKYGSDDIYSPVCNHCWFCEYSCQRSSSMLLNCKFCPYRIKYGHCHSNKKDVLNHYGHWFEAKTPRTRKKYAKLFLEQIKQTV